MQYSILFGYLKVMHFPQSAGWVHIFNFFLNVNSIVISLQQECPAFFYQTPLQLLFEEGFCTDFERDPEVTHAFSIVFHHKCLQKKQKVFKVTLQE